VGEWGSIANTGMFGCYGSQYLKLFN